jgi:hypothetical protein
MPHFESSLSNQHPRVRLIHEAAQQFDNIAHLCGTRREYRRGISPADYLIVRVKRAWLHLVGCYGKRVLRYAEVGRWRRKTADVDR